MLIRYNYNLFVTFIFHRYYLCIKLIFREKNPRWAEEIRDDVIEECNKHGGVLHVFVDRQSAQGNVYVKCPTIATAAAAVNSLHGRWFAGKQNILQCSFDEKLNNSVHFEAESYS